MKVVAVIASAGRPGLLADAVGTCLAQTYPNIEIVVSVPDRASLPVNSSALARVRVVVGARGLCAQRNAGLTSLTTADFVLFIDDDTVLHEAYVESAVNFFREHPTVVGLTGRVVLDGVRRGEVTHSTAMQELAVTQLALDPATACVELTHGLYGCNMMARFDAANQTRFDEELPLYSWLEDRDFGVRLRKFGSLAQVSACVAVHRGATSGGRTSHLRYGYSQIANPVHLLRKGSLRSSTTASFVLRALTKNAAASLVSGDRGWRRERLRGNLVALKDAMMGRMRPDRILDL